MVSSLVDAGLGGFEISEFVPRSSERIVFEPSLTRRGGFELSEFAPRSSKLCVFELELDPLRWLRNQRIRATLEQTLRFRA